MVGENCGVFHFGTNKIHLGAEGFHVGMDKLHLVPKSFILVQKKMVAREKVPLLPTFHPSVKFSS